jgi:GNAT superfamily N-acetyltransferase
VKTTYLQTFERPQSVTSSLTQEGLTIIHARKPTLAYYRFLVNSVGKKWNWEGREKLSDAALSAIIRDPRDEIHVLFVDGVPAGFIELDRRIEDEIEIVHFGLMPEFIGQGLGKVFLQWATNKAWNYNPKRLWLHTDTEDHPAALPLYLRMGFVVYKEVVEDTESDGSVEFEQEKQK